MDNDVAEFCIAVYLTSYYAHFITGTIRFESSFLFYRSILDDEVCYGSKVSAACTLECREESPCTPCFSSFPLYMHIFDDMTIAIKLSEKQTVVAITIAVVIVFTDWHPDTATQVDIGSKLKVFAKESLRCVSVVHITCQFGELFCRSNLVWIGLASITPCIAIGIDIYGIVFVCCLSP